MRQDRQPPAIDLSLILESNAPLYLMPLENPSQLLNHRRMTRVSRRRSVGAGEQSSSNAFEIKHLLVWKSIGLIALTEERVQRLGRDVRVVHLLIIGRKCVQQFLVGFQKSATLCLSLIPNQQHLSSRLENAPKFAPCGRPIKPMKGLERHNPIDAF